MGCPGRGATPSGVTYTIGRASGGPGISANGGTGNSESGGDGIDAYGGTGIVGRYWNIRRGRHPIPGGTHGNAGSFIGTPDVSGYLSKSSGSFKIDHPLDPANKYLYHSFVESPDMKNI